MNIRRRQLSRRALGLAMGISLSLSACSAEVGDREAGSEREPAAPVAMALEVRVENFLGAHRLDGPTRQALKEFAREQRAVATATREIKAVHSARLIRARRRALRKQADAILTAMPASLRAAMHRRNLSIHNLARAIAR